MDKKLYYKDEKGRYREYQEPEPPFDNALYRKMLHGKKVVYEPVSMLQDRDLAEGVWVVVKNIYGKSYTSGKYLNDCFMCLKASDIQEMPLSKLGGMEKLANWLCHNWGKLPKDKSCADLCRAIVGLLFQYEKKDDGNKQRFTCAKFARALDVNSGKIASNYYIIDKCNYEKTK